MYDFKGCGKGFSKKSRPNHLLVDCSRRSKLERTTIFVAGGENKHSLGREKDDDNDNALKDNWHLWRRQRWPCVAPLCWPCIAPLSTVSDDDDDNIAQEERRSIFSAPCVAPFSAVSGRHRPKIKKKNKGCAEWHRWRWGWHHPRRKKFVQCFGEHINAWHWHDLPCVLPLPPDTNRPKINKIKNKECA